MDQNSTDTLSVLAQLLELSAKEGYYWIGDALGDYLEKKNQEYLDDLTGEEQEELITQIAAKFPENGQEVPDYIKTMNKGTAVENDFVAQNQIQAPEVPNPDPNADPANQVHKSESEVEFEKKLSVLKDFLSNMDGRLAKYESADIDELTELLDKYQGIGDPEKLSSIIEKLKAIKEELNITDTDDFEDVLEYLADKLKSGTQTETNLNQKSEGNEMDQNKVDEYQSQIDDLKAKLARYEELGTPEELKEIMDRVDETVEDNASLADANADMAEKLESAHDELAKYREIGTPAEINGLVDTHIEMRTKAESARIAEDLGIDAETVARAIDKFESVSEAEEFVRGMFSKNESDNRQPKGNRAKHESDERADFVGRKHHDPKPKHEGAMDDDRKATLKSLCDKL
jgi:plasmid stabilization system protein ParE